MNLSIRRFLLAKIAISVVIFIFLGLLAIFFLEPKEAIIVILLSYPCLGFLVWIIARNNFNYLKRISDEVHQKAFDREKRFATSAAHELKTPLAAIKTHTQIALNATNESEQRNALDNLLLSVDRSAHLIHQLLTLNRVTYELALGPLQTVNLVEEVREIIAKLVPLALTKKTEIEFIAPTHPVNIQGNEIAIEILVQNLVDNAICYTQKNSLIRVVIEETPGTVVLKIIDNGPGISEHLREQVLESFFRVVGNKTPGSGLGLMIVQQIVDLHHAVILLGGPAGGETGLEVTVTFPV